MLCSPDLRRRVVPAPCRSPLLLCAHARDRTNGLDQACPDDVFNITLAGFLIGAGNGTYYACSNGWSAQTGWDK